MDEFFLKSDLVWEKVNGVSWGGSNFPDRMGWGAKDCGYESYFYEEQKLKWLWINEEPIMVKSPEHAEKIIRAIINA